MKTIPLFLFFGILTLTSCLRLDNNMFNPNVHPITEYKFNNYTGPQELSSYMHDSTDIADSLIHLLKLESDNNGDKASIYAVYIGSLAQIARDTVILYCHGNKDHMDLYWNRAELLANAGGKNNFGVLMLDYRGYGLSEGKPSESGLFADVDAAMLWLRNNGLSSERLVIYGYSLGTGAASELTARPRTLTPNKLILESPYASVEKMQQDANVLNVPISYYANIRLANADAIQLVQQPFLWIHGVEDDFIKIEHGEVVSSRYQGQHKVERRVEGGAHSNVPGVLGLDIYMKLIAGFIRGTI